MNSNDSIGSRFRKIADDVGSVKRLAEMMQMAPPAVQHYLNDKREPGTQVLLRLHKYGYDINWLLTGEGTMLRPLPKDISKYEIAAEELIEYRAIKHAVKKELGIETVEEIKNLGKFVKSFDQLNGVRMTIFEEKKDGKK